jgi:cell division protein FtsB
MPDRADTYPLLGTVLISVDAFRRAMRENRELKARVRGLEARVRELETAARAVVEAEAALLRTPTLGQVDTSEAAIEALARLLGVELPE